MKPDNNGEIFSCGNRCISNRITLVKRARSTFHCLVFISTFFLCFSSLLMSADSRRIDDKGEETLIDLYSVAIYSSANDWDRALEYFHSLMELEESQDYDGLKIRAANYLFKDLCISHNYDKALRLYKQVRELKEWPDAAIRERLAESTNYIIGYYLTVNDFINASQCLENYPDTSGYRDAAFLKLRMMKVIAGQFAKMNSFDKAIETAESMTSVDISYEAKLLACMTYYTIFYEMGTEASTESIEEIFTRMYSLKDGIDYNQMIAYVGNFLIVKYSKSGEKDRMRTVEEKIANMNR